MTLEAFGVQVCVLGVLRLLLPEELESSIQLDRLVGSIVPPGR